MTKGVDEERAFYVARKIGHVTFLGFLAPSHILLSLLKFHLGLRFRQPCFVKRFILFGYGSIAQLISLYRHIILSSSASYV